MMDVVTTRSEQRKTVLKVAATMAIDELQETKVYDEAGEQVA